MGIVRPHLGSPRPTPETPTFPQAPCKRSVTAGAAPVAPHPDFSRTHPHLLPSHPCARIPISTGSGPLLSLGSTPGLMQAASFRQIPPVF